MITVTKGQMKRISGMNSESTASQTGKNSQSDDINLRSYSVGLILRRNRERSVALSGLTIESAKQHNNPFQNSKSTQYHHKLHDKFIILDKVHQSKMLKSQRIKMHHNSNVESTLTRTKQRTNYSNNESNNAIQL